MNGSDRPNGDPWWCGRRAGVAWHALTGPCLAMLLFSVFAPPVSAQASKVFVVAKLAVDAKAKNAVAAKRKALAIARQRAMRKLLKRITPFSAYERLPKVKASLVQDMLEGFSVRRERNSGTRYLATLDFTFQPMAVKQLLVGYGIPFTDQQAPPIRVLPIFLSGGAIKTGRADVWRKGWLALDLAHALTPVRLAQPSPSLTPDAVQAVLSGDARAYEDLRGKYKTLTLVLAIASVDDTTGHLVSRLYGFDQSGSISLLRQDRIAGNDLKGTAKRAAEIALRVIEGRWKLTRSVVGGSGEAGGLQTLQMIVAFSGLQQWQQIRGRLAQVPGVQALEVISLSARSANVAFQFSGGAERLRTQLASRDLVLQNVGSRWILRSN